MRIYANDELDWIGNKLGLINGRRLVEIVPDEKYPAMWRVKRPDGSLTDMVNITRARDAARAMALRILNTQETMSQASPIEGKETDDVR